MKIIDSNEEYVNRIKDLYEFYKSIFLKSTESEPEFTVKITSEFENDLYNEASEKEKRLFDEKGIPELNAVLLMPKTESLHFTILFKTNFFENNKIVQTAIHEFTHAYDYYEYFSENGNLELRSEEEKESKFYYEFCYWSEYHATRIGTLFYLIIEWHRINGDKPPPDGIYSFQSVDLPSGLLIEKINEFNNATRNKSHNANDVFWELFLEVMYYFGRLSPFQGKDFSKYPDRNFPRELLKDTLGTEIFEIYSLLMKMDSYKSGITSLQEFKRLKDSIISKVNQKTFIRPTWFNELKWSLKSLEDIMSETNKFKIPSFETPKIPIPDFTKIKTVWHDIVPLLKEIANNTKEIKKDLKEIKQTLLK